MTSSRFPKTARLTRSSEFRRAREKGQTHYGRYLLVNMLREPSSTEARVGLITGRRLGNAVQRNRLRRRLREIVRLSRATLPQDLWLVVVAKSKASGASYSELLNDWERVIVRAGLVKS